MVRLASLTWRAHSCVPHRDSSRCLFLISFHVQGVEKVSTRHARNPSLVVGLSGLPPECEGQLSIQRLLERRDGVVRDHRCGSDILRLASGHTAAKTWPQKRFQMGELGSACRQRHELHPIAPTGSSNATDHAARMMNDAAHSVEDQKPQTLRPRGKILLGQSQAL